MLSHRLRRSPNSKTTLDERRLVLAGVASDLTKPLPPGDFSIPVAVLSQSQTGYSTHGPLTCKDKQQ